MFSFIRKNRKLTLLFLIALVTSFFLVSFAKDSKVEAGEYLYFNVLQSSEGYSNVYAVKSEYHKDKFISHFEITGATKEERNILGKGKGEISVYHVLDVDIDNLWNTGNKIAYDSYDGDIYGADFQNQEIGFGAVYILETFYDETGNPEYESYYKTNFLTGRNTGEPYLLYSTNGSAERDISILLFYKVSNGIGSWSDYFRVNFDFSIRNDSNELNFKTIGPEKQFENEIPAQNAGVDIANESYVFNGFYIDYMGNQFYTTTVSRNGMRVGIYNFIEIQRVYFSEEGKYEIINENAFGEKRVFCLTVDRYKPKGIFRTLDYNYIFSGFTIFEWAEPQGYEYRSSVAIKISFNGGEFKPFDGGLLNKLGYYQITLSNAFYDVTYEFAIVADIKPEYNYLALKALNGSVTAGKYYFSVEGNSGQKRLFSLDNYDVAREYAFSMASLALNMGDYISPEEYADAINIYAQNIISIKYYDLNHAGYEFDEGIGTKDTLYLNDFTFKNSGSPMFSDKVYYLRQEDYPYLEKLDLATALQYNADVFEYDKPVSAQLINSGTYLILDTNIFGKEYSFKAVYVVKNETNITIEYIYNGFNRSLGANSDESGETGITPNGEYSFSKTVDEFALSNFANIYDKYAVVKISYLNSEIGFLTADYYTANYNLNKVYRAATTGTGVYLIECYDRNGFYFSFEINVRTPYDNQIILERGSYSIEAEGSSVLFFDNTWTICNIAKDLSPFYFETIKNDDTYPDMDCIYFNDSGWYIIYILDELEDLFVIYFTFFDK